jgi:hypothetical protein
MVVSIPEQDEQGRDGATLLAVGSYQDALQKVLFTSKRFHLQHHFTASIVRHGHWKNTSLTEATNARIREAHSKERARKKRHAMGEQFKQEAKRVQRLQDALRRRQQRAAAISLRVSFRLLLELVVIGFVVSHIVL